MQNFIRLCVIRKKTYNFAERKLILSKTIIMREEYYELNARYLNPLTDFGFRKIFGTESNKDLLIDFLNQVIKEEGLIVDVNYLKPEQLGNFEKDRKAVFDIFCTTENGEYFIVEMQKANRAFFRERCIYYTTFPIQQQAQKGIWNFRLNTVYLVGILDFILFDEFKEDKEQVVEYVSLMRERTKTVFSNKLKFAFVQLPKFRKTEKELENQFDKWLYLLKNLPKLETKPAAVQGRIFEKLFELSEIEQIKETEMDTYRKSVMEYYDVQNCMEYAREGDREKWREEGRKEGIQKCLQKNIAIEDVVFLKGYSKEQITNYMAKS